MIYDKIEKYLDKSDFFINFDEIIKNEDYNSSFTGLNNCSKSILLFRALKKLKKDIIFITNSEEKAEIISNDINVLLPGSSIYFPDFDTIFYERRSSHQVVLSQRIKALFSTTQKLKRVYCLTQQGFIRKIFPKNSFKKMINSISVGMIIDPQILFSNLIKTGYEFSSQVEQVGQIAKRGSIIDIFPIDMVDPIRIDFFEEMIEEIRSFDANTQISKGKIEELIILPKREFQLFNLNTNDSIKKSIKNNGYYQGIENDISLLCENTKTFFSYLKNPQIFFDNFNPNVEYENFMKTVKNEYKIKQNQNRAEPKKIFESKHFLYKIIKNSFFFSQDFIRPSITFRSSNIRSLPNMSGNLNLLKESLRKMIKNDYNIFILSDNIFQSNRLKEVLEELTQNLIFLVGGLSVGIDIPDIKLSILTNNQIFDKNKKYHRSSFYNEAVIDYKRLDYGDIIVHIDYGIGIFERMKNVKVGESDIECLVLKYAKGDTVYLPTYNMKVISKYLAPEGVEPKLDVIGSISWKNKYEKTKKSIKSVAKDLLELYAKRQVSKGISFDKDSPWQTSLEESFIYQATEDQLVATQQIKEDMESLIPMERLLCGDVGFGKTEVAIRATFKAVNSSYQVCLLAPTTLLAEQLYFVFKQRLSLYPINIALFSRFVDKKQLKKNLNDLSTGGIDIAIGTHRLLSKDVVFSRLGLLIVDDEHRFGVNQKEKIRKLKSNVDTLYMSATPIPRTLNMALSGTKQISLLQSAPSQRLKINTIITPFNKRLIKQVVYREISRSGQIFFIHNSIKTMEKIYQRLKEILPKVTIRYAHGQMKEKQLEQIMSDFYHNRFQLLIASTIIENGIDIPNANTIFVNRADRFGLAQLYQMRGRVGRGSKEAYCYFIVPNVITENQRKRLETLNEHNYLGAGYQIALMDMHIRGIGNLLGSAQSGNIIAVGYNYYNQLLSDSIKRLKGKKVEKTIDPKVQIKGNFTFPKSYISNGKVRLKIYDRMSSFESVNQFDKLKTELIDRFGEPPQQVLDTLQYFKIRFIIKALKILSLKFFNNELKIIFSDYPSKMSMKNLMQNSNKQISFDISKNFSVSIGKIKKDEILKTISLMIKD